MKKRFNNLLNKLHINTIYPHFLSLPEKISNIVRKAITKTRDLASFLLKKRNAIIITSLIIIVGLILKWFILEIIKDRIIIEPISTPVSFEAKGLSSTVIANKLRDQIQNIQAAARIQNRLQLPVATDWTLHNIQVPKTGIDLRNLIRLIRTVLDFPENYINGEITIPLDESSNSTECINKTTNKIINGSGNNFLYLLTIRVENNSNIPPLILCEYRLDLLIKNAAQALLRILDPVIFAIYWMDEDFKTGNYDITFRLINELLQNNKIDDDKWAYNLRGYILANYLKNMPVAIDNFQRAIHLDPNFERAYFNWAFTLDNFGYHEEAIEKYQSAITINPDNPWSYNNIGVALGKLGKHTEAIKMFKKATNLDNKIKDFYLNRAVALRNLDRHNEANELLMKYVYK